MTSNIVNSKYCVGCAKSLHVSATSCPACGARQGAARTLGEKSKVLAVVLALFLGGIGIHKFYLGRIGFGILYLLFCWTFIPAIIAFIEAIVYVAMSDESFAAKYG